MSGCLTDDVGDSGGNSTEVVDTPIETPTQVETDTSLPEMEVSYPITAHFKHVGGELGAIDMTLNRDSSAVVTVGDNSIHGQWSRNDHQAGQISYTLHIGNGASMLTIFSGGKAETYTGRTQVGTWK